jgi:2,4-dienoyl-CoA reductase (NADPH2)
LYEKNSGLGGQWNIATASPGKKEFAKFTNFLQRSLVDLKVPVKLDTEMTKEKILKMKPDAVVVATGAVPVGLDVPGIDRKNVVQSNDVLTGKVKVKGRAVVIGGRSTL